MNKIQQSILKQFFKNSSFSSGDIYSVLQDAESVSQLTVKRNLTILIDLGYLEKSGAGRSVKYNLTTKGALLNPLIPKEYLKLSEGNRGDSVSFDTSIFEKIKSVENIFSDSELVKLQDATLKFNKNKIEASDSIHKKELERFIIELSWKSSKIEGNTYTLLDTELLLREGLKSDKNTESETKMILNHKKAFDYIYANRNSFKDLSIKKIEEIHFLLTDQLDIKRNLRKSPVGITGSIYRPLDNEYQIQEALYGLVTYINSQSDVYIKSLMSIIFISYIQPFEDGNKRTARLLGNAILLAHGLAPLSYRNVDEVEYRAACLVFYEQNSVYAFKNIFVDQYVFSCDTYNLA